MQYRLYKKNELNKSTWAGGTTTQLYIFPEDADYKAKTFEFRISTATVELEESDFTQLEGVDRQIMTLSGNIKLMHDSKNPIDLAPLQIHRFSGGVNTKSIGKCIDFNLMTIGTTEAEMSYWLLSKETSVKFIPRAEINKTFFYSYSGEVSIRINSTLVELDEGDFLACTDLASDEITLLSSGDAIVATVYVWE
jgi:environmental stress-induced protein Ves